MAYIDNNLLSDETILFRTKKHLIIFALPVFWTLFAILATAYMMNDNLLHTIIWTPWLIAGVFWIYTGLQYVTSDFVVTNKRLMLNEGFFFRHSNEMRLATISQVNIEQSLLGRILNYGMVSINAFGAFDSFATIARPYLFQKAVNEQLDKLVR